MVVKCELCKTEMPNPEILDHFRLVHPEWEIDSRVDTWPDGGVVYVDEELSPSDFQQRPK